MKLPSDAEIAMAKFTDHLLVPLSRSDKSALLARGGYTLANALRLAEDLRTQILPLDAQPGRVTPFGQSFEIRGQLVGPSGVPLSIRTIWLKDTLSGRFRFQY
ncbi:MAG: hypothetical protein JO117_07430, partial [Verrucomicrobia bacterium]|nr:hypothetical protein [Verrucomicrobiota bacterium]